MEINWKEKPKAPKWEEFGIPRQAPPRETHPKEAPKKGRPSAWELKIKKHLAEIAEMRSEGATIKQIATQIGVDPATLYRLRRKSREFQEAMFLAHRNREEGLQGKLWELATGKATRFEEVETQLKEGGEIVKETVQRRTLHLEPSLPAALALLRRFHGWKAEAEQDPLEKLEAELSETEISAEEKARQNEKLRRIQCEILGIDPNMPDPKKEDGGKNPYFEAWLDQQIEERLAERKAKEEGGQS